MMLSRFSENFEEIFYRARVILIHRMREIKRVNDTSACISDSLPLLGDSVSGDSSGTTAYHLQEFPCRQKFCYLASGTQIASDGFLKPQLRVKNAKIVCENILILTLTYISKLKNYKIESSCK